MESKTLRALIVLAVIALCAYVLYPTIQWHFIITEADKIKYDKSPIQLAELRGNYDEAIARLKKIVPRNKHRLKRAGKIIFNIRPLASKNEEYLLNWGKKDSIGKRIFRKNPEKIDEFLKLLNETEEIELKIQKYHEFKKIKKRVVQLGLDLAGGTHLTLAVDKRDLVKKIKENFEFMGLKDTTPVDEIIAAKGLTNDDNFKEDRATVTKEVTKNKPDLSGDELKKEVDDSIDKLKKDYTEKIEKEFKEATDNAITVIRNRVNGFGVKDIKISKGLGDTIFIELPGLNKKDVEGTIKDITRAGDLNFKIVDEKQIALITGRYLIARGKHQGEIATRFVQYVPGSNIPPKFKEAFREKILSHGIVLDNTIKGSSLYPFEELDEFGNSNITGFTILKNKVEVEGKYLSDASVGYHRQTGVPEVLFNFDSTGAKKFGIVTTIYLNKRMAIVLDGKVKSDPRIKGRITSSGSITLGNPTVDEVKKLVAILKAGVLPAKLNVVSSVTIGPSLGAENIDAGLLALGSGLLLVAIFMIFYYKVAGFMAVIALSLNLYFLFSVLSAYGFTLTLPGIAGIILTIGMAVDANVIIFERLREEAKVSKSRHAIINAGYGKAFSAIFDSNLTTILAALVLSQIGSGIIKGFGFTLMWGIICSMFTALFVTRLMMDFVTDVLKFKKVSV